MMTTSCDVVLGERQTVVVEEEEAEERDSNAHNRAHDQTNVHLMVVGEDRKTEIHKNDGLRDVGKHAKHLLTCDLMETNN